MDFLQEQRREAAAVELQMPQENEENHHSHQAPTQRYTNVSNLLGRSSHMRAKVHLCKGNVKMSAAGARRNAASAPFVSGLSDSLVSHFYELISCSQKLHRQRVEAQPGAGRRAKSNRFFFLKTTTL